MPNYVTNIVSINGSPERVAEMVKNIAFDGRPGTFDFNKVIPMPKSLELTEGTITNTAVNAYLSVVRPNSASKISIGEKLSPSEFRSLVEASPRFVSFYRSNYSLSDQEIAKLASESKMERPEDLVLLGKQYIDNYREHGALTWYGWSNEHWGTKWNNGWSEPVFEKETGNLHFDTAWSMPEPIFVELSKQYPDITLEVNWADEEPGYNVGVRTYRNGECIDEYIPEPGSEEALEMSYDIRGVSVEFTPIELSEIIGEAKDRAQAKQPPEKDKTDEPKRSGPEL